MLIIQISEENVTAINNAVMQYRDMRFLATSPCRDDYRGYYIPARIVKTDYEKVLLKKLIGDYKTVTA